MRRIIWYSLYDLLRSRWTLVYFLFYLALGFALLFLNNDVSKALITIMNIIVVLTPLIGTLFGVMFFYNSIEFTELLLAQPIKRQTIFLGQYLGLSLSLSGSLVLGLGLPFLLYGISSSGSVQEFLLLLTAGVFLTFIFTALAFNIGLSNTNRIRGFGSAILMWLFMAVIYDGLFLIALMVFDEYPIDKFALIASCLNPIDLSRILILLKLDISVLLGYTGAVFQQFFGTTRGMFISLTLLMLWVLIPIWRMIRIAIRKDF
ncbi:MAG: ABC transporter permease [Flavobacteriales bacterium]|nr:ABC transporter permease [Flavobacteriales bacterium]